MAAGLGFKTFTTGEVLTAADVNGYLMQGILVFANAAARTSAITSPQEGQYSFLKDTNALEYYDGAAWVGAPVGDITAVTAGTGISGGGSSGAVTITNDMATTITASGDIVVGTGNATYDNLPIGTTGQVLTADTTVSPYKVKWAAASAGALTFISRTSFSNVASQAFDNVFTSTYDNYLIILDNMSASTAGDDLYLQLRYAGPTTETGTYYGWCETYNLSGSEGGLGWSSVSAAVISTSTGSSVDTGNGHLYIQGVGNSSEKAAITGQYTENVDLSGFTIFGGMVNTARTYTGFLLKSSSTNITGTATIYGYAKS